MQKRIVINKHILSNSSKYECRDLSYRIFEDMNFKVLFPVSFYRSDFRGTKFISDTFYKNNFDLADFISNSFINTEFNRVNFGNCEFKNGVFVKCHFNNNTYGDLAIHNCDYKNCIFENEKFHMTMFDCCFYDCKFINCIFDQCSTERLDFDNCTFIKVEMSTMHAENFKFSNCILRDTFLGACFLGTYLFNKVDIKRLSFKYRGKLVSVSENDYFQKYLNELHNQKRYYEFLNLYLLIYGCSEEYYTLFCKVFEDIFNERNIKVLEYNIMGIFDILEFYFNTPTLSLLTFIKIFSELSDKLINDQIPSTIVLLYSERLHRLETLFINYDFDFDYLSSVPDSYQANLQIHLNDDSFQSAEDKIEYLFNFINDKYLGSRIQKPIYKIIEEKKGSVIITISSCLLLALLASKVIKGMFCTICEIRIALANTKKQIELINTSKSSEELKETVNISQSNAHLKDTSMIKIYNALGKDYIISTILKIFL